MTQHASYDIDETLEARHTLRDGCEVKVRTLRREDQELLLRAFERLSERSRYQRFLAAKAKLSGSELEFLVDVDNQNHMAIGATVEDERGDEEGVGLARFVRFEGEPEVAEVAVAVIDDYQGIGLGRLLLSYLVAAARERGIRTFRADCFTMNQPMRTLFEEIGPTEVLEQAGPVITLDIPLTDSGGPEAHEQIPPL